MLSSGEGDNPFLVGCIKMAITEDADAACHKAGIDATILGGRDDEGFVGHTDAGTISAVLLCDCVLSGGGLFAQLLPPLGQFGGIGCAKRCIFGHEQVRTLTEQV